MSLVERYHQAKKEREARIAARAVPDTGVNLKNGWPVKVSVPVKAKPVILIRRHQKPQLTFMFTRLIQLMCAREIKPKPFVKLPITVENIIKTVAVFYGKTVVDIKSHRRTADVVRPRQVAVWLCKELTEHSLPVIGRLFGGRDHTTILHSVRKITRLRAEQPDLDAQITEIETRLKRFHSV